MRARGSNLIYVWLLIGCGLDSGDGNGGPPPPRPVLGPMCASLEQKYRACDVISTGAFICEEPVHQPDLCAFDCMNRASCTDLVDLFCRVVNDAGVPQGTIAACAMSCTSQSFLCNSGEQTFAGAECDGFQDCADGSDELNCRPTDPDFMCASGELAPANRRCDGFVDCADGSSDEAACPREAEPICNRP